MRPEEFKRKLTGVIAFSPTFFDEYNKVDTGQLRRHIEMLVAQGVDSVAVCGGAGEFYALKLDETRAVFEAAVAAADGRIPIIAGVGQATNIAVDQAVAAKDAGASGILIHPLYFVTPGIDGLVAHFDAIGASSGLGLIVFSTASYAYSVSELVRLADIPQLVAVKDEVGDLQAFKSARLRLGDRLLWINGMGEIQAWAYARAGAMAMTSGIVNFAPRVTLDLWAAAIAGDQSSAEALMSSLTPVIAIRSRRPGYHIAIIKEALNLLGQSAGPSRLPLCPFSESDRADLAAALKGLNIVVSGRSV